MTEKMDKQIRDFIENTMCELVEIERVKDRRNKAIIFVKFICDCGAEDRKKWLHFTKHPNCIKCNDRSKISVDEIKAKVNGFGHEFVSIEKKIIGKRKRVFVNFICKCDKETTRKIEQMQWDILSRDATCNKCTYQKRIKTYRENHPDKIKEPKEKVPYDTERRKLAAQKAKQTCLDKFGVDNPAKAQCIKDKIKQARFDKDLDYCLDILFAESLGPYEGERRKLAAQKARQTSLDKYGVDNPAKAQCVKDKFKRTCLDRYGLDHPTKLSQIKDKIKQTNIAKFGVDNVFKLPEVQAKAVQSRIDKYGVDSLFKLSEFKAKAEQTCLEKYGTKYPLSSPEIQQKAKATSMRNYGVEYPMQNAEVRFRNFKSCTNTKKLTLNGKIFDYQGYEDAAIKQLVMDGYSIADIFSDSEIAMNEDIPIFMYEYNGTMHRYYPDLMIWSEGKFIEVKSEFTYSNDTERVYAKAQAVKRHGFDIEIWVYTCKKELVNIIKV